MDYQDDRCQTAQSLSIAQAFFALKGVRYILGPGCDHCLLAIAETAEKHGAILFSTGLLGENVFAKHSNVINLATQISSEAKRLALRMRDDGVKRLALVHGTNTFGEEYNRGLADNLNKLGVEVASEAVDLGTTDYRTIAARLLSSRPDAFFIHQGEQEIISFLKQLRSLDKTIKVYSQYGFETESIRDAGSLSEGVIFTYPLNSMENSGAKQRFDRLFAQRFGDQALPSATSYYVYDGLLLLAKAIMKCGAEESACVKRYFAALGDQEGISGSMHFRQDGGLDRQYGIKKLEGGKFSWISRDPA